MASDNEVATVTMRVLEREEEAFGGRRFFAYRGCAAGVILAGAGIEGLRFDGQG